MVWRVVEHDDRQWNVSVAAERRAHSAEWNLVFSFRCPGTEAQSVWVTYPLSSASKAALFAQAEKLPNEVLAAALAERLG
ncbi:MAG TPA: hypothetical protein VFR62_01135 [Gemmatimonadales bacterium]|nr:hypothetical protein [Gemmatimonadales bacterium]